MSLHDLTRASILAGISAQKWEGLVRQWAGRNPASLVQDDLGSEIWKAIRPLLSTFPRDRTLQVYVRVALTSELLPMHVYVSKLVTPPILGSTSKKREELATLDTLCQLALVTHYAIDQGGLLMPLSKVPSVEYIIETIHNAIELVKLTFSKYLSTEHDGSGGVPPPPPPPLSEDPIQIHIQIPSAHHSHDDTFSHHLITSAPELLCLILGSLDDMNLIPSNEVARLLEHINEITHLPFGAGGQQIIDWSNHLTFMALHAPEDIFSTLNLGGPGETLNITHFDAQGTSSESTDSQPPLPLPLPAPMPMTMPMPMPMQMQMPMQIPMSIPASVSVPTEVAMPPIDGNEAICAMLARQLVRCAATVGAGNVPRALASVLAAYRSMGSNPEIFITNLFVAVIRILSNLVLHSTSVSNRVIWKSFIVGRLPFLLKKMEDIISHGTAADGPSNENFRSGLRAALTALFAQPELLNACDTDLSFLSNSVLTEIEEERPGESKDTMGFKHDFLQAFVAADLVTYEPFALELLPDLPSDPLWHNKILVEAQEHGMTVEAYFISKFEADASVTDISALVDRTLLDFGAQPVLVDVLAKRFLSAADSSDFDQLSYLSRLIHTDPHLLNLLALHVPLNPLIARALAFLEDFDYSSVGDAQSALGQWGDIALFVQASIYRFQLKDEIFASSGTRVLHSNLLTTTWATFSLSSLSDEDREIARNWMKAIFDSNSDGIHDGLLRSTPPQTLLRLASTIIVEAINEVARLDSNDWDTFQDRVSYFEGPVLSWTLAGVLLALAGEAERQSPSVVHLEVLKRLVTASGCPRSALLIASSAILRVIDSPIVKGLEFDNEPIRSRIKELLHLSDEPDLGIAGPPSLSYLDAPSFLIRKALTTSAGQPISLSLRQLFLYPPKSVVMGLFHELRGVSVGGAPSPYALATSVAILTTPRDASGCGPSLLPFTLKIFVPLVLTSIEDVSGFDSELTVLALMVGTAVVTTWHMERARKIVDSFCKGENGVEAQEVVGEEAQRSYLGIAPLVAGFTEWLQSFATRSLAARKALLQKLRSNTDFAAHFVSR